ncbi:leucine-rich repeat domain-containing protein [Paenibacillus tritici]|uniref:stalk domain-containing protein n=1 Tax=Paenibacillus tritici TaxID=1873425 RepID=UPI001BAB9BEB|nr:stalk domain-containing protein [Paenibacillus tritici]QUL52101.1 leucine-rich repeat domain-containing protein [Paenibacillus tritici]
MCKPIKILSTTVLAFLLCFVSIPSVFAEAALISDKNLEQAIRVELKKPAAPLTKEDLQTLTSLYPSDSAQKIISLSGLEYAVNLESLMLPGLGITNIEPLKNLYKVTFLALNDNQLSELEPLQALSQLEQLNLDANNIEKLDALAGLTHLTDLLIGNNQLKDLSPIQSLDKLNWLIISDNQIQSLEPLRDHPELEHLYFDNNRVQDISVLTSLPKLKEVSLSNNPLNASAKKILTELAAKGVKVLDEDSKEPTPPSDPDEIMVQLNGESIKFQVPPIRQNGSVMVPFRTIFEALGLKVDWDPKTQTIKGSKTGTLIKLKVGSTTAEINGNQQKLTVAASNIKGSTYVPLRFIGEAVDAKVNWLAEIQTATISTKQLFATKDKKVQVTGYSDWRDVTSSIENAGDHQLILISSEMSTLLIRHYSKSDLDMNLQQYVSFVKKDITEKNVAKITEQSVKVGNIDAKQLAYSVSNKNEQIKFRMILFEKNNEIYTLVLTSPSQVHRQANAEFNEMLKSVKLK